MSAIPYRVYFERLAGTHYEIGRALGKRLRELHPRGYIDHKLRQLKDSSLWKKAGMDFDFSERSVREGSVFVRSLLEIIHPDLLEEVAGFAEGLEEDPARTLFFAATYEAASGC